jgi:hypothetical protein
LNHRFVKDKPKKFVLIGLAELVFCTAKKHITVIERIHLIGNSSILSGSGMGEEIDSFPVVRINDAPTSGYEEDVGERTEARIICGDLQMGSDTEWISTLSGETLILYPTPDEIRANAQRLAGDDNSLRYLGDKSIKAWGEFLNSSPLEGSPTSGLFGAWFLSNIARRVHLYGFGFFESTGSHHYWEDIRANHNHRDENGHEPQVEKIILKKMDRVILEMETPSQTDT